MKKLKTTKDNTKQLCFNVRFVCVCEWRVTMKWRRGYTGGQLTYETATHWLLTNNIQGTTEIGQQWEYKKLERTTQRYIYRSGFKARLVNDRRRCDWVVFAQPLFPTWWRVKVNRCKSFQARQTYARSVEWHHTPWHTCLIVQNIQLIYIPVRDRWDQPAEAADFIYFINYQLW